MKKIENDFQYIVENSKASITEYIGNDENLIIPEKLGGYEVVSIEKNAFEWCKSLISLEIPYSVTIRPDNILPEIKRAFNVTK